MLCLLSRDSSSESTRPPNSNNSMKLHTPFDSETLVESYEIESSAVSEVQQSTSLPQSRVPNSSPTFHSSSLSEFSLNKNCSTQVSSYRSLNTNPNSNTQGRGQFVYQSLPLDDKTDLESDEASQSLAKLNSSLPTVELEYQTSLSVGRSISTPVVSPVRTKTHEKLQFSVNKEDMDFYLVRGIPIHFTELLQLS